MSTVEESYLWMGKDNEETL